jgi:hypothetical protein
MNDYIEWIDGIREDIELNGISEIVFKNCTELLVAVKWELEKRGFACEVILSESYPILITVRKN